MIDESEGTIGGYKEVTFSLSGTDVYAKMKFESGVHRGGRAENGDARARAYQRGIRCGAAGSRGDRDPDHLN